jgi:hypothetical protein
MLTRRVVRRVHSRQLGNRTNAGVSESRAAASNVVADRTSCSALVGPTARYVRPWAVRRVGMSEGATLRSDGVCVWQVHWVSLGHAKREWTLTLFCRGASVGAQRRRRRHRVGSAWCHHHGCAVGPGPTKAERAGKILAWPARGPGELGVVGAALWGGASGVGRFRVG